MSSSELKSLLDALPDTREFVFLRAPEDPNVAAWRDAAETARRAWRAWRGGGGRDAYAAYRAAQDREDAAQDALARALAAA
jgi:hypothetical protein